MQLDLLDATTSDERGSSPTQSPGADGGNLALCLRPDDCQIALGSRGRSSADMRSTVARSTSLSLIRPVTLTLVIRAVTCGGCFDLG